MYYDLEKKIEEYSEEVFVDLGLATLSEDVKADLYARVQEHLHKVIISVLEPLIAPEELAKVQQALDQEDYHAVNTSLARYPQYKEALETKIDEEFNKLKLTMTEEQKNAGNSAAGKRAETI